MWARLVPWVAMRAGRRRGAEMSVLRLFEVTRAGCLGTGLSGPAGGPTRLRPSRSARSAASAGPGVRGPGARLASLGLRRLARARELRISTFTLV